MSETLGECAGGAVRGNLVMLDALRCADEAGIAHGILGVFADEFAAFLHEALHRLARMAGEAEFE